MKYFHPIQALLPAVLLLMTSCATVFEGPKTSVNVENGTPAKAKVYVDGKYTGSAPTTIKIEKKKLKTNGGKVEIQADGHETQTIQLTKKAKLGFVLLDIVTGIVPLIVDFATGNIYGVKQKQIQYNLTTVKATKPALEKSKFKVGERIIFSYKSLKNMGGVITTINPDKAVVTYNDGSGADKEMEVPLQNIIHIDFD